MSGINFVGKITSIPAHWANAVNTLVYDVFGAVSTIAGAQAALGLQGMAYQMPGAVEISGGNIDGVNIGSVTPVVATFQNARVLDSGNDSDAVVNRFTTNQIALSQAQSLLNTLLPRKGDMLVRGPQVQALQIAENSWALQPNSASPTGLSWTTFTQLVERNPTDDPGQRGFAGDIQVRTDTEYARLPVGTDGQVLMADSSQPQHVRWSPTSFLLPLEEPGDLITYANGPFRLPVGANGQVLVADSERPEGLRWANVVFPTLNNKGDLLTRNNAAYQALSIGSEGALLQVDDSSPTGIRWAPYINIIPVTTKGDLYTHDGTGPARLGAGSPGQVLTPNTGAPNGLAWTSARSVLPLTTKGDILVDTGTTLTRLPLGTDGYVLQADPAQITGLRWAPASTFVSPLTTKGDLYAHNGVSDVRLPAGSSGQVLIADPGSANGIRWATRPNYVSPLTTKGDILVRSESVDTRLNVGTAGQVLTVDPATLSGLRWADLPTAVTIPLTSKGDLFTHDGTDSVRLPVGSNGKVLVADSTTDSGLDYRSLPYDLQLAALGELTATSVVGMLVLSRALTIPANWVGSVARALVAPSTGPSQFVFKLNGVPMGTLEFAQASLVGAFTPQDANPLQLVAGDVITLETDSVFDTSIRNVAISLAASGDL